MLNAMRTVIASFTTQSLSMSSLTLSPDVHWHSHHDAADRACNGKKEHYCDIRHEVSCVEPNLFHAIEKQLRLRLTVLLIPVDTFCLMLYPIAAFNVRA